MKKSLLLVVLLPLLTSCMRPLPPRPSSSSSNPPSELPSSTPGPVEGYYYRTYNLLDVITTADTMNKSDYIYGSVDLLFKEGDIFVPYITLNDYISLFKDISLEDVSYEIKEENHNFDLKISRNNRYFSLFIDYQNKTLESAGYFSSFLASKNRYDTSSIDLGYHCTYDVHVAGSDKLHFNLVDEGEATLLINDEVYYPFSFLSILFDLFSGHVFYFNYSDVFLYEDTDDYNNLSYYPVTGSTRKTTPKEEQAGVILNYSDGTTPSNVTDDEYNAYSFIFRNVFGFKEVKNIDIDELFTSTHFEDIIKDRYPPIQKEYMMTNFLSTIDDLHTAFYKSFWDAPYAYSQGYYYSSGPTARAASSEANTVLRGLSTYHLPKDGSIVYSTNEKTAYFTLNSFNNICFDIDMDLPCDSPILINGDDFFFLRNNLETIKNQGGVERVIIDVSLNGGGYLTNMEKMLSLLQSSDGTIRVTFKDESNGEIYTDVTYADANLDGNFDDLDYYGDDFDIYIMTSNYSYSCGNAFPYIAEKLGLATIIGTTSGGGECSVYSCRMPTGEEIYYSSLNRIGYYENDTFLGAESGAYIEEKNILRVNDANRYRLDYLDEFLKGE